jgi:hypothetical protein
MMRFMRTLATALVAISMAAGSAHAQTEAAPEAGIVLAQAKKKSAPRARHTGTHVYLLRGFMDVFSTGMNELGTKLNRRGIRATVHNHSEFQSLANTIGERHRQGIRENVVIIGHSLGANDAFRMAERLNDFKITVPLIIAYDPTATMSAGSNVSRVVNFYSSTNGWGVAIARGPGFRGSLSNIDLSRRGEIGHTDIDKSPALHSQSINYVQSIGGSRRATTEAASPAPKKDTDEKESAAKAESKTAEAETKAAESKTADADAKKADEQKTADADMKKPDEPKTADADSKKTDEPKTAEAESKPAGKDSIATKDTSAETTASVNPDKKPSAESKPAAAEASAAKPAKAASEKTAEAKPSADKTETAASSEKKESTSN